MFVATQEPRSSQKLPPLLLGRGRPGRPILPKVESPVPRGPSWRTLDTPAEIPLYGLTPLNGPNGVPVPGYRGVQEVGTERIITVVSDRYGLVQHRSVAEAVLGIPDALGLADPRESPSRNAPPFPLQQIRLYAQGRRLEVKLVLGARYRLDGQNEFFPAVRVYNSLDGAWALRLEAFAVRLACANQLYAGARSLQVFREVHLSSSTDLLGQLQRSIHVVLERFEDTLDTYSAAIQQQVPIAEVTPRLLASGIPRRHVESMARKLPVYFGSTLWGSLSRWEAYNFATEVLTHEVQVNPERERQFERAAARALLVDDASEEPSIEEGGGFSSRPMCVGSR